MRIGCAYHPREHVGCGKFHFIHQAFTALGHDVYHVQTLDDLKRADQVCDIVLFEQRGPASLCIPDLVEFGRRRKAIWVQWYFDLNVFDDGLPIEKQVPFEPFLEIARVMDLVLVKEKDRLPEYQSAGVNAVWFDQGCPSGMQRAVPKKQPEFDVVLWGSSSRPMWRHRWEDVDTLVRAGFEVAWATVEGSLPAGVIRLPGCQPMELPDLIEKAAVTLVVDARNDIRGYWSDRIWLAAGAGACIVRRMGVSGGNLPGFGYFTGNSMLSLVADLCDDFEQRERAGELARRMTFNGNTYEARCLELVKYAAHLIEQKHEDAVVPGLSGDEDHHPEVQREGKENALSGLH